MQEEKQIDFDFNEILNQFRSGKRLTGKDGLLAPLIKQLTEAALEAEVESHIANDALNGRANRRNGFNSKTIKGTSDGSFELETPIGRFSYKKVSIEAYSLGVDWIYDDIEGGKFIATPEKALCDKIKYDRGIGTLTQTSMSEYLKYDLRLDITKPLNYELIEIIAKAYKSRNLKTLATLVKKGKI